MNIKIWFFRSIVLFIEPKYLCTEKAVVCSWLFEVLYKFPPAFFSRQKERERGKKQKWYGLIIQAYCHHNERNRMSLVAFAKKKNAGSCLSSIAWQSFVWHGDDSTGHFPLLPSTTRQEKKDPLQQIFFTVSTVVHAGRRTLLERDFFIEKILTFPFSKNSDRCVVHIFEDCDVSRLVICNSGDVQERHDIITRKKSKSYFLYNDMEHITVSEFHYNTAQYGKSEETGERQENEDFSCLS